LGAELSTLNKSAVSETDKAYTLKSDNSWTELGSSQIKEVGFVLKEGANTLVLGTDYEVKWAAGLVRPLASGGFASGGAVTITYEALALEGHTLSGGEVQEVNWRIKMDGLNIDTNEKVQLDIPLAQVASSAALNLLQNEYLAPEFEGVCSVADGKTKDYEINIIK